MGEATMAKFTCDGCGRQYRWTPELAGRAVKCGCGTVMTVPAEPPVPEEGLYDLVSEEAARPAGRPVVAAPVQPVPAEPAPRRQRGNRMLAYQGARTVHDNDAYFPNRTTDLHMPVALLAGGICIQFIAGWWDSVGGQLGTVQTLILLGAQMVVGTVLMMAGVFFAARRRGFRFGPFWGAVLKLSAISVAPGAAMTLLHLPMRFIPLGIIFTWVAGFCFYFALLGVFFELDQEDTWYCVAIIFFINLAVAFGALFLVDAFI